jgi:biotin transport system ATP-binding protein
MTPRSGSDGGLRLVGAGLTVAGKPLLSDVTLHLTSARIGIVGRNGSGKTSLLRLMAGLVAPTSGTVRLDGIDPAADRRAALARVGILFQNPDQQILFPTVIEELAFGLRQMGRSEAEAQPAAQSMLARHGRAHWAGASVATLSQGQRQLLCLMSVLAMEPATLLLDEPFAALDLPTRARLQRLIAGLAQRVVIVSHDPAALRGMDRVVWLERGQVVREGAATEVLAAFAAAMDRLGDTDADTDLAG